jgi:hypothetical protein
MVIFAFHLHDGNQWSVQDVMVKINPQISNIPGFYIWINFYYFTSWIKYCNKKIYDLFSVNFLTIG